MTILGVISEPLLSLIPVLIINTCSVCSTTPIKSRPAVFVFTCRLSLDINYSTYSISGTVLYYNTCYIMGVTNALLRYIILTDPRFILFIRIELEIARWHVKFHGLEFYYEMLTT